MPTILPRRLPDWLHVLLLVLALSLGAARPAHATHLLGGEMSYVYIDDRGPASSPYRYRVTLTGYYNGLWPADQSVRQPPTTVDFQLYYQGTGAAIRTFTSEQVLDFGSPVYPRVPAGCGISGPSQPFYLLKYSATVNLPFSATGYFAVCTQRDRNLGLTNVNNPPAANGQGATVPMTLYVSMSSPFQYNRSPIFSDTAVAVVCANDTTIVLNNAVDPDGDELKYQFGTPYGSRSTVAAFPPYPNPVPYFTGKGFSGTTPLGTGPGNFAIIDANTGTARYGATTNGLYVVAVDVGEYRVINGTSTLIGTTRRDLQLVVSTCPVTKTPTLALPVVSGAAGSYTVEEGQLLSLPLSATQADGHPLALTLNSVLLDSSGPFDAALNGNQGTVVSGNPTGTAVLTNTGSVGGTFTFTPACGQARETPYDVAVTVKDNGCAGKTAVAVIRIRVVKPSGPTAIAGDATVCGLGTTHRYTASGGTAPSVRWRAVGGTFVGSNTGQTVQVTWAALPGKVVAIGVSAKGCATDSVSKAVTLVATPALTVSGPQTICQGSSTTIAVSGAGTSYTIAGGPASGTGPFVLAPTATTTYTITSGQLANGCASSAQVTITVNPLPAATVGAATRSTCASVPLTLGAAPVAGSTYAWSPATGLSSSTVANPTLTLPNATGAAITQTYTLTETIAATGCQASHSVTVTVSPAVAATPGAGLTLCAGVTGQLGAAPVAGYTYSWAPATGLSSATSANPTVTLPNTTGAALTQTYTLTVTNTATGCVGTGDVTVTVNPAVTAVPGAAVSFCAGSSAQLGAAPVVGLSYSWVPATGLSSATSANPTVTLPNATTAPITLIYTLTVTSTATGCASSAQVTITVNPLPVAVPGAAVTTCSGVPVSIGGLAVAGLSYRWLPATGLNDATLANPSVTLTNTTGAAITQTYTLTVTNGATTCASTGTVVVTVNPAVTATPGNPLTLCSGTAGQLGAAPVAGYTYSWAPATGLSNASSANPTVTLTYAGSTVFTQTYTLTTTNAATGCVGTATVTVTVNPLPVPQPGAAVATCSGVPASIGAAAVAGYTYSWAPATGLSDPTSANPTVTLPNPTGAAITQAYTLTVTNTATSCVGTGSVVVTVNPAAAAVAGPAQTVCDHATVALGVAARPGYTYAWSPATNLSSATVAQPVLTGVNTGTAPITQLYKVRATTAAGCVALDSVLVTINPRPVADTIVGPQSVCPTVTGIGYAVRTPRASTYHWAVTNGTLTGGQGTAAITVDWPNAGTGTVSVYATNALTCNSDVAQLPVRINKVLQTATPTGPSSVCQANGPFTYQTVLATGSMYSWQLFGTAQGTLVNTGNATSISFTQPGTAKLVVTETSNPAGGICRGTSDTLTILVKPSPSTTLAIQGPAHFCVGSGDQPYSLPGNAGSGYVFTLDGAVVAGSGSTVVVPGGTAAGSHILTAQETSSGGCGGPVYTSTFTIDPLPGAVSISGPLFVCPSGLTQTYTVANANPASTFQWTVANATIAGGQGTASITVAFGAGLASNATVSVVETSAAGCGGATTSLTVVPDNATAPLLDAVTVLDDDNTKTLLSFRISAPNSPNPVRVLRREAGSTGPFVQVGTVPAPASGTQASFQDSGLNAAQTAYEYSLDLTTGCGDVLMAPVSATTILLKALAVPGPGGRNQGSTSLSWLAYGGATVAQYVLEQQLDGKGYAQLATLSGTTLQYSVPNTGQGFRQCYRVRALLNGSTGAPLLSSSNTTCVDFAEKTAFYNIITPNGDGLNDKLEIDNVQLYPGNSMQVFNRWGREVFSTTNYNNDRNYWGNDPGIAAGVYYYLFKTADGTSTKGWVEVVR